MEITVSGFKWSGTIDELVQFIEDGVKVVEVNDSCYPFELTLHLEPLPKPTSQHHQKSSSGRKVGRPQILSSEQKEAILEALQRGESKSYLSRQHNVSRASIRKVELDNLKGVLPLNR